MSLTLPLFASLSVGSVLSAQDGVQLSHFRSGSENGGISSIGMVAALHSRMDLAVHSNKILPNHHKGALGEEIAGQVMSDEMAGTGNWNRIHSSFGRNGLGLVHLRYGRDGLPNKVQTAEVKADSSRLNMTKTGMQASPEYVSLRLKRIGQRWDELSNEMAGGRVKTGNTAEAAISGEQIPVVQGRKTIVYYKSKTDGSWYFDGQEHNQKFAFRQVSRGGLILGAGAKGIISVTNRVVHVQFSNNEATLSIYNASEAEAITSIRNLPYMRSIVVHKNILSDVSGKVLSDEIFIKSPGMSRPDANLIADEIRASNKDLESFALLKAPGSIAGQYARGTALGMGAGAAFATVFDVGSQIISGERYDPIRTLKSAGIGAAAGGAFALTYQGSLHFITAHRLLLAGAAKFASAGSATIIVSVGFAYIGYFTGAWDINQANRHAAIGVISGGVGLAAGVLTFGSMSGAMSGPGALVVVPVTIVVSGVLYVTCDWWDNKTSDEILWKRIQRYKTSGLFMVSPG